jgi:8-oxo-dGTP pyrophosphatase MutT (NUDIX family)
VHKDNNFLPIIEAAGGAVVGADGRVLMMLRRGMWDLPKGHREEGETMLQCALREVAEECGLEQEKLLAGEILAVTDHNCMTRENTPAIKQTTWYSMIYVGDQAKVHPQTEEDITAVEWLDANEARRRAATSYETIKTVIDKLTL